MLEIAVKSKSKISDAHETITWRQLKELADEVPEGVHYLSGGNSVSQASVLLAAAEGRCSAVPFSSRITLNEREDIHNLFGQITAPTGVFITTSGSQGKAKLVHLSPEVIANHAHAVNEHLLVAEDDMWLACLPFFHVGGMAILMRCAIAGAGLKIIENSEAELVAKHIDKTTLISLVPTTLQRVLSIRNDKLPESLRAVILGGGPIPMDLVERCPQVLPTYGLTEAGSMVTCARPKCADDERRTAGPVLPHAQIKILNDDGVEVANDQAGRIVVKSSGAATEYFRNEKETALTFREGWIHTEDAGYLDAQGYLHVLGRRDRIIVSGGENISLEEVEAALRTLGNVRDALCVGLEDPEWGQLVVGVIETDTQFTLNDLREHLRNKIASHKTPKRIITVAKLHTLANGKPDYQSAKRLFG